MELTQLCATYFYCTNLYDVFGIDKNVDRRSLKKAYFKCSLKYHPNHLKETIKTEEASEKFKTLFKIYSILSDKERKWVYDSTGCVWLEEKLMENDFDWVGYWRLTFNKVNDEAITSFVNKYRGSQEEITDIKQLFKLYKGDLPKIMKMVLCSTPEDESRIQSIILFVTSTHSAYSMKNVSTSILENT